MKVMIDLLVGSGDIQKNIDAQERAIAGNPIAADLVCLIDTLYILKGIQEKLELYRY